MTNRNLYILRALALILAIVLIVFMTTACGDDDFDDSTDSVQEEPTEAGLGIAETTDREGTLLETPAGTVYIFCHDGDRYSLYGPGGISVSYGDGRCI